MQEIKKRRIVLASVLKPVNDPRMFEKMGQSLSAYYDVHIIGTSNALDVSDTSIVFHPLTAYTRLSIDRILAPLRILKKVLDIKPDLLIICTHELLWMVLITKVFLRCKVIYDVRENYYRNILYTRTFPRGVRIFIALYVRLKEWITSPFITLFFLAEAGYEHELEFVKNKKVILENKVKKIPQQAPKKWSETDGNIHLLFSGTLAVTTGVFIAIELASKLHEKDQKIRLHIIGFSPLHYVYQEIKKQIKDKPFIQFKGDDKPVPHPEILQAIQAADSGIIAYPPNLSTQNTIPTKLYEYMGCALPILLIDFSPWVKMCQPYHAAIPFNMKNFNAREILRALKTSRFYTSLPLTVFWEIEEKKLLDAISICLK
jgi:glycosyltransferase involved in cell wall biosynthesis